MGKGGMFNQSVQQPGGLQQQGLPQPPQFSPYMNNYSMPLRSQFSTPPQLSMLQQGLGGINPYSQTPSMQSRGYPQQMFSPRPQPSLASLGLSALSNFPQNGVPINPNTPMTPTQRSAVSDIGMVNTYSQPQLTPEQLAQLKQTGQ
jgi:hypothetical protein